VLLFNGLLRFTCLGYVLFAFCVCIRYVGFTWLLPRVLPRFTAWYSSCLRFTFLPVLAFVAGSRSSFTVLLRLVRVIFTFTVDVPCNLLYAFAGWWMGLCLRLWFFVAVHGWLVWFVVVRYRRYGSVLVVRFATCLRLSRTASLPLRALLYTLFAFVAPVYIAGLRY